MNNRMRILLANVGANSSHRQLFSPIFKDGTFEFLPIPESDSSLDESNHSVRYRDMRSYYHPDQDLLRYVPQHRWNNICHNDPDFDSLTYGDNGTNGRSSALTQMKRGDALLFLARLDLCINGERTRRSGFYLIGGLVVHHAGFITVNSPERHRFSNNTHMFRGDAQFFGIAGSDRSRRFERAVPINKKSCDRVFRDKNGNRWTWTEGRSELARIGSYTRACRCMLDTAYPEQEKRTATLRDWVQEHSGENDAKLLEPR